MLTDAEVISLLNLVKEFVDTSRIDFPVQGEYLERELKSEDGQEHFLVDINRKGRLKVTKCTFQNRYRVTEILLRLDIDGPPHENPDGTEVPCPHLHVYRSGYSDKWAYAVNPVEFTNTADLARSFREFLKRCNVEKIPEIQKSI